MMKRLFMGMRGGLLLAVAGVSFSGFLAAQGANSFELNSPSVAKGHGRPDRLLGKSAAQAAFSISVEPLGFSAPGALYLGARNSLVSLDFLDENRLLFTFRVPGLIHREPGSDAGDERQIRAVVLSLPSGTVESEALWTLHDRARYLWMLKDGHFLLRDGDELKQGDASLELKPFLHFPGPLTWMELDPSQQYLVTDSRESAKAVPGDVPSPATAEARLEVDGQSFETPPEPPPDMVVRILRRDSGKVMLVSHVRLAVHLPINADGYLESLRSRGVEWLLNLSFFSGGSKVLGRVESACAPTYDFVSQRVVLVTTCSPGGPRKLVAMDTDGHRLWEDPASDAAVWPLVVRSPDGSRLARETLSVSHAVNAYSPLAREDIKGQLVEVFNAADGKVALSVEASPALDAGGNVAFSPSGRRMAVLNANMLQIFDLPALPALTKTLGNQTGN